MQRLTNKHPAICYHDDIKSLCAPLTKLQITYFAHAYINKEKQFSVLNTSPDFLKHYMTNSYYNCDMHTVNDDLFGRYVIWDSLERQGLSRKMHEEASLFGVNHTFTIIKHSKEGSHFFHFATDKIDPSFNQIYLNNLDTLELFTHLFKERVAQQKSIAAAYNMTFDLDSKGSGYVFHNKGVLNQNKNEVMLDIQTHISPRKQMAHLNTLTKREWQVLLWLHYGKSLSQISAILTIAEVTVNKIISRIKEKTNCYSMFSLGEYFAHYCGKNPALINYLLTEQG